LDLKETKKHEAGKNWIICTSSNIIRVFNSGRMRSAIYAAQIGEIRNTQNFGTPEGKRPLRRPRRK
jgi:hypothetical protein